MTDRQDRARWPAQKAKLAGVIASRTSEEWCRLMVATDACFAPVLEMGAAAVHPHNVARGTFVAVDGMVQPSPAPRFQRTTLEAPTAPKRGAAATAAALIEAGLSATDVDQLLERGVLR
jgi:alpha-methylacyl-CoA racemase